MTYTIYTKEMLQSAVDHSVSISGVLRFLNLKAAGGTHAHITRKITLYNIDTTHFTGQAHSIGRISPARKSADEILIVLPFGSSRTKTFQLRRAMLEVGFEYACICGITNIWCNEPIQLEIDHIDGNWYDNRRNNLRFLCPNCHSQQEITNKSWKNK